MVAKISVFILHWHLLFKLCQWGALCRHSILHTWFHQGEWLQWPIHVPQKSWLHYMHQFALAFRASFCFCITCINSFIAYQKNDLEILTVTRVFSIFKSNNRIERYRMIKFAWSTYIVSRYGRPHMISLN